VPTYQYLCTECGGQLEAVQKFTDEPLTVHEDCGGRLRKVFSPVGIVFKGSGFYRTDSRGKEPSAASSSASAAKENGSKESGSTESGSTESKEKSSSSSSSSDSASSSSKSGGDSSSSSAASSASSSSGRSSGEKVA
jgi:putative FmdB family regulatory protein